jgi:hypothetical protein
MGSNMANEMASGVLEDMGIHIPIEKQIAIHLSSNHYPPVPSFMVAPCIQAIDAVNDAGLWDLPIKLPEGISWRGSDLAPASAIIEAHHLEAWLIEREY